MPRSDEELVFVVPGRLDQLTGGYLYDRHIVEGLRARGRTGKLIELAPGTGRRRLCGARRRRPQRSSTALPCPVSKRAIAAQAHRLRLVALVHHPLAEETGLSRTETERLAALEAAVLPHFRGVLCPSRRTAALSSLWCLARPDRRGPAGHGKAAGFAPATAAARPARCSASPA